MIVPRRNRVRILVVATLVLGVGLLLTVPGCASSVENRNPLGEVFPEVSGRSLEGDPIALPAAFDGQPVVLLVGYEQDAQFDADRWLLGAMQARLDVAVREIPTIDGLIPGLLSSRIDEGMRRGIPSEDWGSVITVYDDADRIVEFTGNRAGSNIRVLLLDGEGRVRWFHDRGYSAGKLVELKGVLESL